MLQRVLNCRHCHLFCNSTREMIFQILQIRIRIICIYPFERIGFFQETKCLKNDMIQSWFKIDFSIC